MPCVFLGAGAASATMEEPVYKHAPNISLAPFWRRRPWYSCAALALLVLAVVDHLAYRGWRGDDRLRYHDQLATCLWVADGDTIDIDIPDPKRGGFTRVRLWGVDTPEIEASGKGEMHFGPEASAFTKQALEGHRVRIELGPGRTRDRFGRLLAYVYVGDTAELFNATLLETGHAYADHRFDHPRKIIFRELEARARRQKRGLWNEVTPDKMPPWRRPAESRDAVTPGR